MNIKILKLAIAVLGLFFGTMVVQAQEKPIRIGHFPNITHAQAVIAHANGSYEKALGVPIEWRTFNAGPSAMESLMAGVLDVSYVGPNPAINAFIRSDGAALKIVTGAASGGASLVIRPDAGIQTDQDFKNKRITTPQLGNTQDVAAKEWLLARGYQFKEKGGSVTVLPIANPEQLILFRKKEIDAAWSPEPWATRLVMEANGKRFLDERSLWPDGKFCVALMVVRTDYLEKHREQIKKLVAAHVEMTQWINANPEEAKRVLNQEIGREVGKPFPKELLDESWKWFEVTYDPVSSSLIRSADSAFRLGYLGSKKPDLTGIYQLLLLNEVLKEKNLPTVK